MAASSSTSSALMYNKPTLLPLVGATSEVWKYFGFPAVDGKLKFINQK